MRLCLQDQGLDPHDVGYVNAHGTSTTPIVGVVLRAGWNRAVAAATRRMGLGIHSRFLGWTSRTSAMTWCRDLGLAPLLATRIGVLSKGQRKRFLLALGLLAPQPLLIIDEPFEGLDLRQSRELEATLRKHVALGRTLFLSIHQIADAARICDRFVLLSNGNLVGEGTLATLSSMAEQRVGHLPGHDFEEIFLALT